MVWCMLYNLQGHCSVPVVDTMLAAFPPAAYNFLVWVLMCLHAVEHVAMKSIAQFLDKSNMCQWRWTWVHLATS